MVFGSPEMRRGEALQLTDKWQDDYGSGNRHDPEYYWHARRAFLNSYHFSEEKKLKEKFKRSVKELNEAAMGIVSDIREEISKRKIGFRVLKIKFALPSLFMTSVRCFTPWFNKRDLIDA